MIQILLMQNQKYKKNKIKINKKFNKTNKKKFNKNLNNANNKNNKWIN